MENVSIILVICNLNVFKVLEQMENFQKELSLVLFCQKSTNLTYFTSFFYISRAEHNLQH